MFQAEIDDDYVAGLWKKNIESQLLWEVAEPDERPLPPTAPSWSWASLRGAVTFSKPTGHSSVSWLLHISIKMDGVKIYLLPISYEGTYTFGALMIYETGEQRG